MALAEITFTVTVADEWITRTVDLEIDDEYLMDYRMGLEEFIGDDPAGDLNENLIDLAFDEVPEGIIFQHMEEVRIFQCPKETWEASMIDDRHPRNLDW